MLLFFTFLVVWWFAGCAACRKGSLLSCKIRYLVRGGVRTCVHFEMGRILGELDTVRKVNKVR